MAKGKKTGGRNFVKGQSGNPDGRMHLPPEIAAARRINTAQYVSIINDLSGMSVEELVVIAADEKENILRACVAAAMLYTRQNGDPARLDKLMDRAIGKVAERVAITDMRDAETTRNFIADPEAQRIADELVARTKGGNS